MRCEQCIALRTAGYEYPETYCGAGVSEDDPAVTEWEDGSYGCKLHPMTVRKRLRENEEAEAAMYMDIGEWSEEQHYNEQHGVNVSDPGGIFVSLAKHCIGMDHRKPYKRHGKTFYRPYRNYYDAGGKDIEIWDVLVKIGHAKKQKCYHLTDEGLRWLGRVLGMKIYEEED